MSYCVTPFFVPSMPVFGQIQQLSSLLSQAKLWHLTLLIHPDKQSFSVRKAQFSEHPCWLLLSYCINDEQSVHTQLWGIFNGTTGIDPVFATVDLTQRAAIATMIMHVCMSSVVSYYGQACSYYWKIKGVYPHTFKTKLIVTFGDASKLISYLFKFVEAKIVYMSETVPTVKKWL